jgi:ABC-type transport system substrate-binding protein
MLIVVTVAALAAAACTAAPSTPSAPTPSAPTSTAATPTPTSTSVPTSATVRPTSPSGVPNCATSELKGSLGPEEGAAGSVYAPLLLANSGTRTCELRGFPGVSYVAGADGHQVGPAAAMGGPRGGEVVLKPGAAAAAQLQLANVANFDAAACQPTPVRGLRVYPPGDTESLYIERAGTGCAITPPGNQLSVQTLKPA